MTTEATDTVLHAVCATDPLTAADAVKWFTTHTPPGAEVIGYLFAARAAAWVRIHPDGTVEGADPDTDLLAEAYEMVLFDEQRELRWLHTAGGRGTAVALSETLAALPPGDDVTGDPPPRRVGVHTRLLAGSLSPHERDGWVTLGGERYATAYLPYAFDGKEIMQIEVAEYVTEDAHGNVDVADTRLIRLCTADHADVLFHPAATTHHQPERASV